MKFRSRVKLQSEKPHINKDQDYFIVCWRMNNRINIDYDTFANQAGHRLGRHIRPTTTKKVVIRSIRKLQKDAKSKRMIVKKITDLRRSTTIWTVAKINDSAKFINRIYFDKLAETISFEREGKYPAVTLRKIIANERGVDTLDIQRALANSVRPYSVEPLRGNGGTYLINTKHRKKILSLLRGIHNLNQEITFWTFKVQQATIK